MKEGPDIARIAALIGDPARANMLTALMSGKALTATELSAEAGITQATASAHLAKLTEGGLITSRKQGRHKYLTLASDAVGHTLETLMGLAASTGHMRTRTGPRDPALRHARVCYNHLAGEMGIHLFESLKAQGQIVESGETVTLTEKGAAAARAFGIPEGLKAPLCRPCLDWSARRTHLAGSLGRAYLARIEALGWAKRTASSRAIRFTSRGEAAFRDAFPL
ncbi:MAG: winged helix-turn-helix domain-containing protein [Pseudomonadota bacterium]